MGIGLSLSGRGISRVYAPHRDDAWRKARDCATWADAQIPHDGGEPCIGHGCGAKHGEALSGTQ